MGEITDGMLGQEEDAEMSGLDPQDGVNSYLDLPERDVNLQQKLNQVDKMVDAAWREDSTPREHWRGDDRLNLGERLGLLDIEIKCPTCRKPIAAPLKSVRLEAEQLECRATFDTRPLSVHVQGHINEVKRVQELMGLGGE